MLKALWSARFAALPACRPSFAASPWPLPACGFPTLWSCRFWSAQLTAISARKPSFAAFHAAFELVSLLSARGLSWGPRGLSSARSLSTRVFPRLWPLLRPPYNLFQHMFSQVVISTPFAPAKRLLLNRSSQEKKKNRSSTDQITNRRT